MGAPCTCTTTYKLGWRRSATTLDTTCPPGRLFSLLWRGGLSTTLRRGDAIQSCCPPRVPDSSQSVKLTHDGPCVNPSINTQRASTRLYVCSIPRSPLNRTSASTCCHGSTGSPSALSEEDSKRGRDGSRGARVLARGTRFCT